MAALNCGTWRRTATVAALVAAFAAILLGSTSSASASASAAGGPETRVGAYRFCGRRTRRPPRNLSPQVSGWGERSQGNRSWWLPVLPQRALPGLLLLWRDDRAHGRRHPEGDRRHQGRRQGHRHRPRNRRTEAKTVEHVWVHEDTVVDLIVDGKVISTTEDHPFWSVTDQRFERADALSAGEKVLGADGRVVTVSGLRVGTTREELAYNLTVAGIHTYRVGQNRSSSTTPASCSLVGA